MVATWASSPGGQQAWMRFTPELRSIDRIRRQSDSASGWNTKRCGTAKFSGSEVMARDHISQLPRSEIQYFSTSAVVKGSTDSVAIDHHRIPPRRWLAIRRSRNRGRVRAAQKPLSVRLAPDSDAIAEGVRHEVNISWGGFADWRGLVEHGQPAVETGKISLAGRIDTTSKVGSTLKHSQGLGLRQNVKGKSTAFSRISRR